MPPRRPSVSEPISWTGSAMPEKPKRASDYRSEQVELVRATCLYVATKLGGSRFPDPTVARQRQGRTTSSDEIS